MAEVHTGEVVDAPATGIALYDFTEAKIAELRTQASQHTLETAKETSGYLDLTRTIAICRDGRNNTDDKRAELKKPYLEKGRQIDAAAKAIISKLEEIEKPLIEIKKQIDNQKAIEKARKEEEDRQRIIREAAEKAAEEKRLADIEAARVREEQDKVEAQQKAEKAALDKQREEQAEIQRKLDAQLAEIAAAAKKLEDAQAAAEAAKQAEIIEIQEVAEEFLENLEKTVEAIEIVEAGPEVRSNYPKHSVRTFTATKDAAEAIKAAPDMPAIPLLPNTGCTDQDSKQGDRFALRLMSKAIGRLRNGFPRMRTEWGAEIANHVTSNLDRLVLYVDRETLEISDSEDDDLSAL